MYKKIYEIKNLLNSFKAVMSDNSENIPIVRYYFDLEGNLFDLQKKLITNNFYTKPYKRFIVSDPKRREISAPHFEDRIVQHAIVNIIEPIFEKTFIEDAYACRVKKGTHFALKRLKKFLQSTRSFYGKNKNIFVLKCDIKKFFASISWNILIEILSKKIKDKETMSLLEKIITSYTVYGKNTKDNAYQENLFDVNWSIPVSVSKRRGLPIGNLTSQLFANIYLNELDQFVKRVLRERWYGRYMDDFFVISGDKKHLEKIKNKINTFLENKLKLTLHPKKSFIQNVKYGVCFVGYRIFFDHVLVRGSTLRRFQKKYRKKLKKVLGGLLEEKKLEACKQSFRGHLKHANTYWLDKKMFG
jgi:retron-type reverse transcriptase